MPCRVVSCRVVSHRIALRRARDCPPPASSCQLQHTIAPHRTAPHRIRTAQAQAQAQHNQRTVPAPHRSPRCVSATSGHLCSHPDPLRLPGFQGFASGGRCCGTPLTLGLVGRYLVAMHLKHATNRLLFICANPRLQGCMRIACFECLPLPPRSPLFPPRPSPSPAQPGSGDKTQTRSVRRRSVAESLRGNG